MAPSTLPLIFAPRFHFLDCKLLPRLGATTARVALGGDMGATTARVGLGGDVGATTARVALDGDEGACASLAFESFSIGTKLNNFETLHMSTHRRSVNRKAGKAIVNRTFLSRNVLEVRVCCTLLQYQCRTGSTGRRVCRVNVHAAHNEPTTAYYACPRNPN